ncbi:DUF2946 family protein [Thauera sp. 2A1]|uniref:DUF2946 family protein n=1 Tax=Thauera sp. 2A1 TaxID=2570191 RepID=UPI0012918350|nr:DUF2946 family protein [Thauera sp. 2A1]KAI5912537.1 DUF2946 family protein [Thauera sp. 2A1]
MSDAPVPAGAKRWPNVPACYGWLSLDRRGGWRLQGEQLTHAGLVAFLNAHYEADELGAWLVNNGPQKVFARLDYTPWVLRLEADGRISTHTGIDAGPVDALYLDEEGSALLHTAHGIGLLDDRDLPRLLAECRLADDSPADDDTLMALMTGPEAERPRVRWRELPLQPIRRNDVAARFGFVADPAPAAEP